MKIYKEGDKSKGGCEKCKKIVTTTFKFAPLKYKEKTIQEILQGFCDICGDAITIPAQSTLRIKEFRENLNRPVELRVPMHFIDILVAIGNTLKISHKPNLICRIISEYYVNKMIERENVTFQTLVIDSLNDDLLKGKLTGRISCMFNDVTFVALKSIAEKDNVGITNVEKCIIIAAKRDVLDNCDVNITKELKEFAMSRLF